MKETLISLIVVAGTLGCVSASPRQGAGHAQAGPAPAVEPASATTPDPLVKLAPMPVAKDRVDAWPKACVSGRCRVYTFTDIEQPGEPEPVRMLLEVTDSQEIFLTAVNTRGYHRQFYTTNPPTYVRLNQKDYVPVRFHFNENFSGLLTVDGKRIATLAVRNESQLKAQPDDFDAITRALELGSSATIEYASSFRGKGQKASFTLAGFTPAFSSLLPSSVAPQMPSVHVDPVSVLEPLLVRNSFSVSTRDLRVKENPYGSGAFVFAPKTMYSGVERLFLWFVKDDVALKLNGATHHLTPSLPFPADASLGFWEGTGLLESTATSSGLEVAFGR